MKERIRITDRPQLYDWLYEDFKDDISMYLSMSSPYDEILECGIGTGRVAIPLAQNGKTVRGVEISSAMINRLEEKLIVCSQDVRNRIQIFQQDMRNLDLSIKFPFVLVPFSTFNYLLNIEDQKKCLMSIRHHLTQQGNLVLEFLSFSMYPAWFKNDSILRKYKETVDADTGKITQLWKLAEFNSATQIITEERYFRFYEPTGVLINEEVIYWQNRFFFLGEIELLLSSCGYKITEIYGDFNFGAYQHNSQVAIVVAKPLTI
jgi:SAM-dependent methyltransferase